jgi:hypothetical protein
MTSIMKIFKSQTAQSLIEVVVAIGLMSIVFTGSWQIMHDSFMSVSQELTAVKAHYLVEEGLEGIRSMRDEDWNILVDGTWHFHYDDSDPENAVLVLEAGEEVIDNTFSRRIEVSSVRRNGDTGKITEDPAWDFDLNTKLVEVIVQWDYTGSVRTDRGSIYLTNWARF